ncbi:uncharacterized protein LY89DRAFT_784879 [Mollisia scopiformis]|uniref:Uncharacterized protein n=1 Tax=Mollisia scopiformis TaxID=149040 RepID=A0A194X2M8_MOLSC|nr:uncharacterized protein LY89DRAFT_784879 [Mollisia scopiformis]KUJ14092.1 hypothetical protein LY89DRAFT_784879 [Mollisia scopiformis]
MASGMSPEERAIYFQDPGHGKVADICLSLGFGDASKSSSSRSYLGLSQKAIDFRKNFVKGRGLHLFPLQYDDAVVQSCANDFLAANEQLFDPTDESRDASRLTLPDDKEKILEILGKLMCTQESMFRRNDEYLKRRKKQVYQELSESEMEEVEVVDESTIHVQPKQPLPPKRPENSNGVEATGTKRSIERHLEYTYPVNEVYQTVSPDSWLFDTQQPWPDSEQAFAFRYFHERNLYTFTKSNRSQVKRFALALQKRLNLEVDSAQTVVIRQRCKDLIKDISSLWGEKGSGFLIETPNGFVKSSQFENAWKFHRNSWAFKVHGGLTDGVIELNQAPTATFKEENPTKKRLHNISPSPTDSDPVINPEPSAKRPKNSIEGSILAGWQKTTTHNPMGVVENGNTPQSPINQNPMPLNTQSAPQFIPVQFEPVQFDRAPMPARAPLPTAPTPPTAAPKAPAFTPVNVLPSNVHPTDLQFHTSSMPRTRPLERGPGPVNASTQPQPPRRSRESMPASSNNTPENANYDLLNLSPSRLTRSKSTGNFAEPPGPGPLEPVSRRVLSSVPNGIQNMPPQLATLQSLGPQNVASQNGMPQNATLKIATPPFGTPKLAANPAPNNPPNTTSNAVATLHPRPPPAAPYAMPEAAIPNPSLPERPQQFRIPDSTTKTLTPATSPTDSKPASTSSSVARPLLSTPRQTETPEPSSATAPLSHQRLTFILENQKRSADHDNPLSASDFRSLSITDFFTLFCERSGRDREKTEYLIFKYNWGYRDSFVVKEVGNEVEWEEIKERVRDTFFMARDRAAGLGLKRSGSVKGKWQVWVMGPEEEDEEW